MVRVTYWVRKRESAIRKRVEGRCNAVQDLQWQQFHKFHQKAIKIKAEFIQSFHSILSKSNYIEFIQKSTQSKSYSIKKAIKIQSKKQLKLRQLFNASRTIIWNSFSSSN